MGLALVKTENESEKINFDQFWSVYPRRQNRKEAEKAWKRIDPSKHSEILCGVEAWKKSDQWARDGGQYIPLPSTFLNNERWTDEVEIGIRAMPCQWPRCRSVGSQKYGQKDFCEAHVQALKRGETP